MIPTTDQVTKRWKDMTKEERRAYHREWKVKNKVRCKEQRRSPKQRATTKTWRAKNAEKIRVYKVKWDAAHPGQLSSAYRKYRLMREYGLTPLRYKRLSLTQGGLCVICDHKPDGVKEKLVVDHCHWTGKNRGLICQQCNLGIGCFRDNPNFLRHAAAYLRTPMGSWRFGTTTPSA